LRPLLAAALLALASFAAELAAPCAGARADVIEMKDGAQLEGQILSDKCGDCAGTGTAACAACAGSGRQGGKPCAACAGGKQAPCAACAGLGVQGARVRIRVRAGAVEIDRAQIRRLVWRPVDPKVLLAPAEYYRQAIEKLDPADARGAFDLGAWCAASGMDAEARRLFGLALTLDPALRPAAAPQLAELDKRRESEAVKALLAAARLLEDKGPEEGAAALRAFRRDFADAELGRRSELQRDLLRRHFPKLADGGGSTVEGLLRTADDRLAVRCAACAGSGRGKCPDCGGKGEGRCPDCAGAGQSACPVCNASGKLTCTRCFGTGLVRGGTLGYNMERICPECNGAKDVPCDVCAGNGRRACKRCGGSGRLPATCATCAGTGATACRSCGGSGLKTVELFTWGPPPVRQPGLINVGGGGRTRAWQGETAGGVITVLTAETLHRGALAPALETAPGKRLRGLAVALDNRKGQKLLRFRPADQPLRGVTEDHAQIAAVDLPKALAARGDDARVRAVVRQASDRDCLPGAYECLLAAFPEGTDADALTGLFWIQGGEAEPVRLAPIWLADDEVEALRKSLR